MTPTPKPKPWEVGPPVEFHVPSFEHHPPRVSILTTLSRPSRDFHDYIVNHVRHIRETLIVRNATVSAPSWQSTAHYVLVANKQPNTQYSSVASFLFPLFASYKALKTSDPAQLTPWLMYWVVLACALLVESWTDWFLVWYALSLIRVLERKKHPL